MILPFNRYLVGARVERISSARAPEMCPFSKTIRENQTVRVQGLCIDYQGSTRPACSFWVGRDRWTGKRLH
jgi:hypothetical protein